VISSYLVANEETWRRGVVLSFASAFLQALVAVAIVGIAAALLGATAKQMGDAVRWIEIASYSLIALMGARLTWVKGRGFIAALRAQSAAHDSAAHDHHGHGHDHGHHQHDHHSDHHHDHAGHQHAHAASACTAGHGHAHHHGAHGHGHHHDHDDHAGHSHGPEPQELAGPGGWQRGLTAIVAVGLRPCSGAILVLVFSLAQGLFWAGVASTFIMGLGTAITVTAIAVLAVGAKGLARRLAGHKGGTGSLIIRGIEVAAAVLVLVFGIALLAGYMASERMFV
jgi:nickel/cobalt exporter